MDFQNKRGIALWIMGPTSSGKTTLAEKFLALLRKNRILGIHYDGDEVRDIFGDTLGFEDKDRLRVVQTLVHLTNKAIDSGMNVVISALTANEDAREYINKNVKNLSIVYLKCGIDTCIERDPKGLYAKAKNGDIDTVIGFNKSYMTISNPDIVLDSENNNVTENVDILYTYFENKRSAIKSFLYLDSHPK